MNATLGAVTRSASLAVAAATSGCGVTATVTVAPTRLVVDGTKKATATCSITSGKATACAVTVRAPDGTVLARGSATRSPAATSVPVTLTFTSAIFKGAAAKSGIAATVSAVVTSAAGPTGTATTRLELRPKTQKLVLVGDTLFATASATLSKAAVVRLTTAAAKLAGAALVTCVGYTDSRGSTAANLKLGKARALAVCRVLGKKAKQTKAVSYGEKRPIATNATAAGRAKNRRVEVIVTF